MAGGIGITGLLAWVDNHPNIKLFWSAKQSARPLVAAMEPVVTPLGQGNAEVRVWQRFVAREILEEKVKAGCAKIGVMVCGHGRLCDDVLAAMVDLGKRSKGRTFVLEVEACTW